MRRSAYLLPILSLIFLFLFLKAGKSPTPPTNYAPQPLVGEYVSPLTFANPYPHIPAQCYIETARGTQNPCQFCHTNGMYKLGLGNNLPQAGASERIGNLQLDYSFAPYDPAAPPAVVNRWENTLWPERLRQAVRSLGEDPVAWDMEAYIRQDNWSPAFARRPGDPRAWDGGDNTPFRLFPGLDPGDLPADPDGFVRSRKRKNGFFHDGKGWITGWRAINFMPYGIFTPLTGSVSGIYIRLPAIFMMDEGGRFSLEVYKRNLDLVERAIQDRLRPEDGKHYVGKARSVPLQRGEYPVGTEFAHPLHYVDVAADGRNRAISPFPGTRARRVKEIRYMYKWREFVHDWFRPEEKEEGRPVYGNGGQGWVDNGVGWILAAFIEDKDGRLGPQTLEELTQCVGCHSGVFRTELNPHFTSGTGNTVDSTWAMPRKFPGDLGWREMDYLGYRANPRAKPDQIPGEASLGDPLNRALGVGEFGYFLQTVVGVSLYGDMPASVEAFLRERIRKSRGYPKDWPPLDTSSAEGFNASQALRQRLLRMMVARGEYLDPGGHIQGALLYPPRRDALEAARRYRMVVVTQRYRLGKDVFADTPLLFRYFRQEGEGFSHLDGTAYRMGEVITDRDVDREDPRKDTYMVGNVPTLIDGDKPYSKGGNYNPDYVPLLSEPLRFALPAAR